MHSLIRLTILLFFCSFNFLVQAQESVTGILDNDDIGAWAYLQHNNICNIVYQSITTGQLTNGKVDGKTISNAEALKMFQEVYVAFVSTSPDDPTVGYDTTFIASITEHFNLFIISKDHIGVQVNPKGKIIYFNKKQFESILNNENKMYFQLFERQDSIQLNQIPVSSSMFNKDINIRLHLEGKLQQSNLYINDSLISKFGTEEKETRGGEEVLVFVSTNPNIDGEGHDSIYYIPLVVRLNDTSNYQFFYFSFKGNCEKLTLSALSCGYMMSIYGMQVPFYKPYGYLKYNEINTINQTEKQALEYIILLKMKNALQQYGGAYEFYMDYFQLESKNDLRHNLKR